LGEWFERAYWYLIKTSIDFSLACGFLSTFYKFLTELLLNLILSSESSPFPYWTPMTSNIRVSVLLSDWQNFYITRILIVQNARNKNYSMLSCYQNSSLKTHQRFRYISSVDYVLAVLLVRQSHFLFRCHCFL